MGWPVTDCDGEEEVVAGRIEHALDELGIGAVGSREWEGSVRVVEERGDVGREI